MAESIIRFIITEKTIRLAEKENKVAIAVPLNASKREIKKQVEKSYGVKVVKVNTIITPKGEKKAIVKLSPESNAFELLTRLGLV
ncbi:MAG: 50S ribosomal protein L23 [Thermocladium sp.]|nr:MAG: 50S ribosomal protein L23 [Thermocladium sp. ECH_B]